MLFCWEHLPTTYETKSKPGVNLHLQVHMVRKLKSKAKLNAVVTSASFFLYATILYLSCNNTTDNLLLTVLWEKLIISIQASLSPLNIQLIDCSKEWKTIPQTHLLSGVTPKQRTFAKAPHCLYCKLHKVWNEAKITF